MSQPISPHARCPHHVAASAEGQPTASAAPAAAWTMQRATAARAMVDAIATRPAFSAEKIPCPALAAMYNAGLLPTDDKGNVKVADLAEALRAVGVGRLPRALLVRAADATDRTPESFNLFELNGSSLDHTGNTGIRQGGVHPERFAKLASFSADGQRLTSADLAKAASYYASQDPGLRGTAIQTLELAAILLVFGSREADGTLALSLDAARSLWVEGKFPEQWKPRPPGDIGALEILGRTANIGARRVLG